MGFRFMAAVALSSALVACPTPPVEADVSLEDVAAEAWADVRVDTAPEADGAPETDTDIAETDAPADGITDSSDAHTELGVDGETDVSPEFDGALDSDGDDGSDSEDVGGSDDTDTDTDTDTGTDTDVLTDPDTDTEPDTDTDTDTDTDPDTDTDSDTGPDAGPFDDLEGLSGQALRTALLARIDNHTSLGYSGDGTAREYMFAVLDVVDGRLECVYTGRTIAAEDANAPPLGTNDVDPIDTTPEMDCRYPTDAPVPGGCSFNTEHSWPQSDGAKFEPARSDIHHLFATFELANSTRANFPFGVTGCVANNCPWDEGGSELGYAQGTAGSYQAFEVRPSFRGNIARAQFYYAVRYSETIGADVEETLRQWHAADPPDAAELARNEGIFAVQGNYNPFVSRPDFVALVEDF